MLSALGPLPDGVAPARPAALDQPPTLEGAKAVATYFVLVYSYAYQTGDLKPWNTLVDPRCVFCESVRSNVETEKTLGRHLVGGAISVTSATGTEVTVGRFFDLTLTLNEAPSRTIDQSGTAFSETSGDDLKANVIVTYDGNWHIRELSTKVRASA
ncbi:hypothetical protein CELL_00549 [Cellulomonas sp. T2.31MG-18]